ncbi:MAG: RNA polymerase factor sigma-54 [Deltaproteobacteria bacterium]|nr:RNA polymerase factor sigma-54 [Deltaproteobacteria bacterium]
MSFLELKQHLKLAQQLVMTPQLQQAIKLLQLSRLELVDTIQHEIEQNPLLEEEISGGPAEGESSHDIDARAEIDIPIITEKTTEVTLGENPSTLTEIDWSDYVNEYESGGAYKPRESAGEEQPSRFDILTQKPDLHSHLSWQLNLSDVTDEEREVGFFILGNLDNDGFLKVSEEEIVEETGCPLEMAKDMIVLIQDMDPSGVGARNVKESLLLQLKRLGLRNSLPTKIVEEHIHFLETKNYGAISKATKQPISDVLHAVKIIVGLDPHPGRVYSDESPHYILPDVFIQKVDDEYVIMLNDEGLPRLKISSYYKEILKEKRGQQDATKDYIQDKLKSAAWLIKSIQQRQRTIYKVVESILKFQFDFFEKGIAHLKPLVLRDVAEDIEMHESTISRVTTNKYVHTPQGIFELKYFFTSSIERKDGGDSLSSESIKERIRQIIQTEDPDKPLSDKALSEIFQKDDIQLARRTVAKYREQLGILSSKFRKKPNLN